MRVLVTGGAGFIGSALVRYLMGEEGVNVLNIDKLTYASNLASLARVANDPRYALLEADICDPAQMRAAFAGFKPDGVVHLAAETHVDRSITGSAAFVETNVTGTHSLLEAKALADRVQQLDNMQRIDQELNRTLDFKRVVELTIDNAVRESNADAGAIRVR